MKTHTPGPWRVSKNPAGGHAEPFARFVVEATTGAEFDLAAVIADCVEEHEANAHLIAAAPELLAALQGLDRIVAQVRQAAPEDSPLRALYNAALAESSAVIAKATKVA